MIKRFAKRILPEKVQDRARNLYAKMRMSIDEALLEWGAESRQASRLYYAVFSDAFTREQQGVLYGRLKYIESTTGTTEDFSLLRRNTHRLEKGLLMRPRRGVFALGYIEETVQAYCDRVEAKRSARNGDAIDPRELEWARDVLSQYFGVVEPHPVVAEARQTFHAVENGHQGYGVGEDASPKIPYVRPVEKPPVSYEALMDLSRRRRSVRWFRDEEVPRMLIDQAIEVAAQAPSACNRQPFEMRVYDDPELVREIASLPGGTKGYASNIPVIIVIVGKLRAYFSDRDRHVVYIDGSLAAMALMYALETLGLSSCPINWPDVEQREARMQEYLKLEPDERPIMLLAVGYPDPEGMVAYSHKKSLSTLRTYNRI